MRPTAKMQRMLLAFTVDGQPVYHCLRWCNRIMMGWLYATDPKGIRSEEGDPSYQFDVRHQLGWPDPSNNSMSVELHREVITRCIRGGTILTIAQQHNLSPRPPAEPSLDLDDERPF